MRAIATDAIRNLHLDYDVTLVSSGASRNVEIVVRDRARGSYFSLRLTRTPGETDERLRAQITAQLQERIAALAAGSAKFGERRPLRMPSSRHPDRSRVA